MRSRAFDRRIEIWRGISTIDPSSGQPIDEFKFIKKVWAEMYTANNAEVFDAEAKRITQRVYFRIRYWNGLRETDQIKYGGRTYRINGVAVIERNSIIEINSEIYE